MESALAKKKKRKDFEIQFYEAIVKEKPRFAQVLSCLGDAYTKKGFYHEGLEVDRRLVALKPEDPIVRYNFACSLSLVGAVEDALKELKKAVLLGYDDISYIMKDPDLDNVRAHHPFKEFYTKAKKINI
jgi:tetratricopeptide (TPR) repeat protein